LKAETYPCKLSWSDFSLLIDSPEEPWNGKNLTFQYDPEGNILYIKRCTPYAEQESEEHGEAYLFPPRRLSGSHPAQ
jgi:hypothetical protein